MLSEIKNNQNMQNRWSNASTVDSSNESNEYMPKIVKQILIPKENLKLLEKPDLQVTNFYQGLEKKLDSIYEKLQAEIEPVNVKDYCSIQAKTIQLKPISNPLIARRRISVLIH